VTTASIAVHLILVDGRAFSVDHPEFVAIDRRGREVTG